MSRQRVFRLAAVLVGVISVVALSSASASAAGKPEIKSEPGGVHAFTGVTFNTQVNPNGAATTYYFEYGKTESYGSSTASASAGEGTTFGAFHTRVDGLTPHTTYYFRAVATNKYGTTFGPTKEKTFTAYWLPPVEVGGFPQSYVSTGTFTIKSEKLGLDITCNQNDSGTIEPSVNKGIGVINEYNLNLSSCVTAGAPQCNPVISLPVRLNSTLSGVETNLMFVDFTSPCAAFDMYLKAEEPFRIDTMPGVKGVTQSISFSANTHFGTNLVALNSSTTFELSIGKAFSWTWG